MSLLAELPKHQRPGGYFAASGLIDWQKPIDHKDIYKSTMMPALWGNARLLCGLVEASRAFPDDAPLLATARRLGDFYVGLIPRFADPARMSEYTGGDTYAAGYVTCYFPAMEGLVKLHTLTGERKYLKAAVTMAASVIAICYATRRASTALEIHMRKRYGAVLFMASLVL